MGVLVRYLLDSHVFLWLDDPERMTAKVQAMLADRDNELFFSVASIWELTLKRAAGKLHFTGPFTATAEAYQITLVPIRAEHAAKTEELPRYHKDPFDHMLVAQALVEDLVLVTRDEVVARYPVPVMRV